VRPMRVGRFVRGSLLTAIVGMAVVGVPAATAATLTFDKPCYLAAQPGLEKGQVVNFTGAGFTPNAPVTGTLDGEPIGSGSASPTGDITGSVNAPAVRSGKFGAAGTLVLTDGVSTISARFLVSNLAADFLPARGNPRSQKVRFYVYGFDAFQAALNRKTGQNIYLHIIDPKGKIRSNKKMGRAKGPCGNLKSARMRILRFEPTPGSWRFVFDYHRKYSRKSTPQAGVRYIVTRTVVRR
jgi:hypothetical protein